MKVLKQIASTAIVMIIACVGILDVCAREYLPILVDGREWIYESHPGHTFFEYKREYNYELITFVRKIERDTVIGDMHCKVRSDNKILYEKDGVLSFVSSDKDGKIVLDRWVDMNLEEGESIPLLLSPYYKDESPTAHVLSVDYIKTGGVERKRIFLDKYGIMWIEGIGEVAKFAPFVTPEGNVLVSTVTQYVSEVYDNDEYVAGRNDFYTDLKLDGWQYVWHPMVRDDRIWIYGGIDKDGRLYKSYCRFGPYERHGIRLYRPFYEYRKEIYDNAYDDSPMEESGNPSFPPALLRDQCGSVYLYCDKEPVVDSYGERTVPEYVLYSFPSDISEWKETEEPYPWIDLIYVSESWSFNSYMAKANLSWMTVAGERRKVYNYYHFVDFDPQIIEGIGMTTNGFLPYFLDNEVVSTDYAPRLLEYCDGEGNVLHKFASLEDVVKAGVGTVAQPDNSSPVYYNLQGQPIANPVRGEIYILRDSSGSRKVMY